MKNFTVRHALVPSEYIKQRIVFNPNYGGAACSVPGTCVVSLLERAMKPKFFEALEDSIRQHGFRNPILVYAVDGQLLLNFGGSRLRIAKRLDRAIPAIIVDYDDVYKSYPRVTVGNYKEFFTDVPTRFEFTDTGVITHYSLERARRDEYDSAGFEWTKDIDDKEFIEEEFPWLTEN